MRDNWQSRRFLWGRLIRRDESLSPAAKMVAWSLCEEFADHESGECYPSIETIATAAGYRERQTRNAIKELEEAGWLRVHRGVGRGNRSTYALQMPAEKGANLCTFPARTGAEKVQPSARKGAAECRSPCEPSYEPKGRGRPRAREPADAEPWHSRRIVPIPSDGHEVGEWQRWLRRSGFGELGDYDLTMSSARPGGETMMPMTLPPEDPRKDGIKHSICAKWFRRRAAYLHRNVASFPSNRSTESAS